MYVILLSVFVMLLDLSHFGEIVDRCLCSHVHCRFFTDNVISQDDNNKMEVTDVNENTEVNANEMEDV